MVLVDVPFVLVNFCQLPVLLQCVVGFAWSFPEGGMGPSLCCCYLSMCQGGKCNSLPALMKNIAEQVGLKG